MSLETNLNCFRSYDIRGRIGLELSNEIVYDIGRAIAQHFNAKTIVVGYDSRETSPVFANYLSKGIEDYGSDVLSLGLAGTEEMYSAVSEFEACAGIEVTASHNPIEYNGLKIVKSCSKPLDIENDFLVIKSIAEKKKWDQKKKVGKTINISGKARSKYVKRLLNFVDINSFNNLKILVNCGNGAAGPTFDAIENELKARGSNLTFFKINHNPDPMFPNGIPNPLLLENRVVTAEAVKRFDADIGIAFDGDFDRCFFFDSYGNFIQGVHVVSLFSSAFLEKEKGATIVHDTRLVWNTLDVIKKNGGIAVPSETGHSFVKKCMRENNAIYGGEISAHHYFRDFSFCDSGMIPWLIMVELISKKNLNLRDWVKERNNLFPSSDEINFSVRDPRSAIEKVLSRCGNFLAITRTDGIGVTYKDWRFSLRQSNTEPLVRLNVEVKGDNAYLSEKVSLLSNILIEER